MSSNQATEAFLVVVRSDEARSLELGRRFKIYSDHFFIGNGKENDILIGLEWNEPCRIYLFYESRIWHIQDVENFSHLSINGVPCARFQIYDGDLIKIGEFVFEFSVQGGIKFEFFQDNELARQQDLLTKAYNRGYLNSVLEWEINRLKHHILSPIPSRREQKCMPKPLMSLIMFDIDHFGDFNKRHDHQVGDEVLKGVVDRTKSRVRNTDLVCRWGGEEFMVYLPETGKARAVEVAEQIRKQISDAAFLIDGKELHVTVSLGVAEYEPEMDLKAFTRAANLNMLAAKNQGRNQVVS